jgi:type I restriction enzyme M protein
LGVGQGSLLSRLRSRWPNAKTLSVDLDAACGHPQLSAAVSHSHFRADVLSIGLQKKIGVDSSFADIAVCNPPFAFARWRKSFPDILKRVGLPAPAHSISFAADILFLAQNLWMLKPGGELGIIVPAGLVNGAKNRSTRDALIGRHTITEVVELPANAFSSVEVRSFILYLKKDRAPGQSIRLMRCDESGALDKPILISTDQGSVRLDYSYYAWEDINPSVPVVQNADKLVVIRGTVGKLEAQANTWPIIHTTDIGSHCAGRGLHLPPPYAPKGLLRQRVMVKAGDILLTRVGRNLQEKMVYVASGTAVISDCIFVIRSTKIGRAHV